MKIPTFILHFGSKPQAESVWQPCKAALVLSTTWGNKYFAAAVRNTFVQSLQILLASGVVNRDISAVQFGQIPFRVGVMLVMITENHLQIHLLNIHSQSTTSTRSPWLRGLAKVVHYNLVAGPWLVGGSINTFSTVLRAREANSRKGKDSIRHFMFYFILRSP